SDRRERASVALPLPLPTPRRTGAPRAAIFPPGVGGDRDARSPHPGRLGRGGALPGPGPRARPRAAADRAAPLPRDARAPAAGSADLRGRAREGWQGEPADRSMKHALMALVMTAALAGAAPAAPTPQVVVTIPPIAMLVRELAGGRVGVRSLVPPGASTHTFSAQPSDVAAVESARLFVEVGAGLDTWAAKLKGAAEHRSEQLVLIELPGLDPLPADPHDHDTGGAP